MTKKGMRKVDEAGNCWVLDALFESEGIFGKEQKINGIGMILFNQNYCSAVRNSFYKVVELFSHLVWIHIASTLNALLLVLGVENKFRGTVSVLN